ncbi:MAG: hypothetical protein ACJ8EB_09515, partial [Allosphingosinicella sp.]
MSRRRSRRREPLTPRRLGAIAAAAALALFAAWWAVKLIAVQEVANLNPYAAAIAAPGDPRVKMRLAVVETVTAQRADPARRAAAIRALRQASLADEPFLLAALDAQAAGQGARSERLLVEARRRNPRERLVRLTLLERYLSTERWADAGREIAVVTRLVPRAQDVLAPGLAKLAANPKYAAPMAQILDRNPLLKDAVLLQLAGSGVDTAQILRLAGRAAAPPGPPQGRAWQQKLLERLIGAKSYRDAFALWARFAGLPAGIAKGVYDPSFAGLAGAPPFNWDLTTGEGGHAERIRGGLEVDYYGRLDASLVRQMLLLAPGRYRLTLRADGHAEGDGTQLQWTIVC